MALGGYANRIAHVDLTNGTVEYRGIPEDWARKYIAPAGSECAMCSKTVRRWTLSRPITCSAS